MPLPDDSRLLSLSAATWRAFGERLHAIRFDAERTQVLRQIASSSIAPLRAPMVAWHARRQKDAVGFAFRMLMIEDPVTPEEAREVLGDVPLEPLVEAGVLVHAEGGGLVSPFLFNIIGPHYVFCDHLRHGGDVVMGASSSTSILCHAGRPVGRVKRALDLGCGAGTAAILYSGQCDRIVATDVNPRAMTIARANVLLNGVSNVELREGDLFAPVAGETFDLVVSQPPFVARPPGAPDTPYLFGGPEGNEVAVRILEQLPSHLAPGGRAVLLCEWPVAGQTIEQRVRAHVKDAADLLLIQGPLVDLDEHCMSYAATRHPELGDEYRAMAMQWRDHFEQLGIHSLRMSLVVLESSGRRPSLASTVTLRRYGEARITGARIDKMLAARDLLAKGRDAILDAKLAIPIGTTFAPAPGEPGTSNLLARPADDVGLEPTAINQGTYKLLVFVDRAARVREAAESVAAATKEPFEAAATRVVAGVTQALEHGLLELPSR